MPSRGHGSTDSKAKQLIKAGGAQAAINVPTYLIIATTALYLGLYVYSSLQQPEVLSAQVKNITETCGDEYVKQIGGQPALEGLLDSGLFYQAIRWVIDEVVPAVFALNLMSALAGTFMSLFRGLRFHRQQQSGSTAFDALTHGFSWVTEGLKNTLNWTLFAFTARLLTQHQTYGDKFDQYRRHGADYFGIDPNFKPEFLAQLIENRALSAAVRETAVNAGWISGTLVVGGVVGLAAYAWNTWQTRAANARYINEYRSLAASQADERTPLLSDQIDYEGGDGRRHSDSADSFVSTGPIPAYSTAYARAVDRLHGEFRALPQVVEGQDQLITLINAFVEQSRARNISEETYQHLKTVYHRLQQKTGASVAEALIDFEGRTYEQVLEVGHVAHNVQIMAPRIAGMLDALQTEPVVVQTSSVYAAPRGPERLYEQVRRPRALNANEPLYEQVQPLSFNVETAFSLDHIFTWIQEQLQDADRDVPAKNEGESDMDYLIRLVGLLTTEKAGELVGKFLTNHAELRDRVETWLAEKDDEIAAARHHITVLQGHVATADQVVEQVSTYAATQFAGLNKAVLDLAQSLGVTVEAAYKPVNQLHDSKFSVSPDVQQFVSSTFAIVGQLNEQASAQMGALTTETDSHAATMESQLEQLTTNAQELARAVKVDLTQGVDAIAKTDFTQQQHQQLNALSQVAGVLGNFSDSSTDGNQGLLEALQIMLDKLSKAQGERSAGVSVHRDHKGRTVSVGARLKNILASTGMFHPGVSGTANAQQKAEVMLASRTCAQVVCHAIQFLPPRVSWPAVFERVARELKTYTDAQVSVGKGMSAADATAKREETPADQATKFLDALNTAIAIELEALQGEDASIEPSDQEQQLAETMQALASS